MRKRSRSGRRASTCKRRTTGRNQPRQLMTLIRLRGQFLLQPQWRRIRVGGTVVRSLQHEECRDRGLIETARAYAPTDVRRHI
jgi:hypothetical protein